MRIAVMLHVRGLRLAETGSGTTRFGGAYTWRVIEAPSTNVAIELATESLRKQLNRDDEVLNEASETFHVIAEEVKILEAGAESSDTGLVFYIDTDDPGNQ